MTGDGGAVGDPDERREKRGKMAQKPARASRTVTGLVFLAWTAAVLLPPLGLAGWRSTRLAELSDPAVQAEWTAFREDMRTQTDRSGPVQRKVPKSV